MPQLRILQWQKNPQPNKLKNFKKDSSMNLKGRYQNTVGSQQTSDTLCILPVKLQRLFTLVVTKGTSQMLPPWKQKPHPLVTMATSLESTFSYGTPLLPVSLLAVVSFTRSILMDLNSFSTHFILLIWLLWVLVSALGIFSCSMRNLVPWPGIEPRPSA